MNRFRKLPNDPALRDLMPFHRAWMLENIKEDLRQANRTVDIKDSDEEYGLPDDDYELFKNKMKKVAEAQGHNA